MKHGVFLVLILFPYMVFAQSTEWQTLVHRLPSLDARRIAHLEEEWQVAEIEPNLLKMTHKQTGIMKYVDITEHPPENLTPSSSEQVIDLINADTTLYNWKYKKINMFKIGSLVGYPMAIGDFNNNGKPDLAGSYLPGQSTDLADCAIAELQDDSTFVIKKVYLDTVEIALAATDVDSDGQLELNFKWMAQRFANIEQKTFGEYPDTLNFLHRMWEFGGQVASETFTDLDNDNFIDVIYAGDDSLPPCCRKIFVAEYNPAINNFERKFSVRPQPDWSTSGFGVGDLDNDGFKEFATGSASFPAHIYMWENTGNDTYEQVYQDTMSISNAYMTTTTNDIDNNGKTELFLGGSSFSGGVPISRIYWFEADGNNVYRKVRTFLLVGTEVLGYTVLYTYDVNSDGVDDLVFSFSFSIAMLVWNNTTMVFDLFYYDSWEKLLQEIHSINMYDIFNDGQLDLFVNVVDVITAPRIRTYFYRPNTISGISPTVQPIDNFILHQNYPNPFNPITTIRFTLSTVADIELSVLNIRGQVVAEILDERHSAGEHTVVFDASVLPSGIYFYRLTTGQFSETRKMVVVQ